MSRRHDIDTRLRSLEDIGKITEEIELIPLNLPQSERERLLDSPAHVGRADGALPS